MKEYKGEKLDSKAFTYEWKDEQSYLNWLDEGCYKGINRVKAYTIFGNRVDITDIFIKELIIATRQNKIESLGI